MKIHTREKNNAVILDLEGNIDVDAGNLVEKVGWALTSKSKMIILNFEGINLVDYVGVSLLAVIYKNILKHKSKIEIYNVPTHVRKLFSIVGLDRVFTYYATEKQALNAITANSAKDIKITPLRRRFKRIPINLSINYRTTNSAETIFYQGKIINLSAEGAYVSAKQLFSIDERLTVRINLYLKPGLIEVAAKVVWLVDKDIQPQDYPGMGLEFINISNKTQEDIIQFVEKHLAKPT